VNMPHLTPVLQTLAWTLLHFIWQGCALAAAFWIVMLVLRRSTASSRYLAGCITLAMMALAPIATFAWLWQRQQSMIEMWTHWSQFASTGASPAADSLSLTVVCIWLLGATSCILWLAGGWMQTRRLRRLPALVLDLDLQARVDRLASMLGVRCVVRIIDHASIAAPLTIGALKPMILLPASMLSGLTTAQLEAILAHEMAHIRRMDFLINLMQAALEAMLFYHPAVWWVSRQVRIEREYCCDDLAADVCGNPIAYARALAQLESLRSGSPRLGLSSQGGSLMKRIARLIDTQASRAPSRLAGAAWGAALAILAATSAALAMKPPAEAPPPGSQPPPALAPDDGALRLLEARRLEAEQLADYAWFEVAANRNDQASPESHQLLLSRYALALVQAADAQQQQAQARELATVTWQRALTLEATGDVRVINEDCFITADRLVLELALKPTIEIDPEHMPSDGLVQAAKLAYPFNLLGLMPWVAPEAHEVLIKPAVEQPGVWLLQREPAQLSLTITPTIEVRAEPVVTTEHVVVRRKAGDHLRLLDALATRAAAVDALTLKRREAAVVNSDTLPAIIRMRALAGQARAAEAAAAAQQALSEAEKPKESEAQPQPSSDPAPQQSEPKPSEPSQPKP